MTNRLDDDDGDGALFDDPIEREKSSTVSCSCGNDKWLVNFIPAPFTGCYLKVTCHKCASSRVLFDDYA